MLTLEKFEEASEKVKEVVLPTNLIYSEYFSAQTGNKVYLKPENMQYTGAYKVRGAYYKISTLSEEERKKGLITASAGNHAQGVAYAAKIYGVPATIVMPTTTPLIKVNRTKSYGAEVVLYGNVYDEACQYALKLAKEKGLTFVHPFNDETVATGQGTIAMEIFKELPTVDIILVPIGGGGLAAGVSTLAKLLNLNIKVIGAVKAGKQMADAIVEYIGGMEVVKAFSQSAGSYKKYSDAVNYNANYYVDWMRENQKTMSAYNAILPSVLICVLPCGFAFWLSGSLELSTFLSIVIFSLGLIGPIIAAFTFTDDLAVLGTNVEEISQLLNAEELNHKETPIKLENTGISLRSVSFSYDGTTEVLHDVNLAIHPGTMTALVGPSGSGKSTVAKLIAGYWDVTSGSITLGGHELKDMPLSEIADQISYVSQDNYLFNRSIRENIRMGRPSATDAEVEQAAKQSGCDAFIRKLDNGYDTVVGSAGSHLSGGERQRIAIARAMLKNAPVVILDEATAYIDPENEALVQKAISTLTVGKTLIVIAHRLSTIVGADNIVVVKDGTIHAQGTHEKLLETCPLYRDMWQAHIGAKDQM